jgi:hypothetical protein
MEHVGGSVVEVATPERACPQAKTTCDQDGCFAIALHITLARLLVWLLAFDERVWVCLVTWLSMCVCMGT